MKVFLKDNVVPIIDAIVQGFLEHSSHIEILQFNIMILVVRLTGYCIRIMNRL